MYKKTITYTNLNGDTITEVLFFKLSRKEALKIMNKYIGTDYDKKVVTDFISKVTKTKDVMTIISFIEDIILSAYGEKSEDGNRFIQTKEVKDKFESSIAYAELFERFITNSDELKEFVDNVASSIAPKTATPITASVVS